MNTKVELGRIAGIPISLDMFFVLVLLFFSNRYFTGNDSIQFSVGLIIIAGIICSILIHELAHAVVARLFRVEVTQIDLTGLGGVIHFGSSLPAAAWPRIAIYLAGPAANYAIYLTAIEAMAPASTLAAEPRIVQFVLAELALINLFLCLFNILPAFPLDGGQALDALLGKLTGAQLARRIVGGLGVLVAILIALYAIPSLPGSIFLLLLAFFIAEMNWTALQNSVSRWRD